jgi:O-antigen/teichoic acid export membrane protein
LNKKEKNQFLKNVLTIFSGSTIAQIINFSAIIILQRYFYSPEEYAPFRLFFEFAAVFSSIAALRLESGLVLERDDNRALSLLRICLKYSIITSFIGGFVFTFYFIYELKVFQYEWLLIILMPLAIFTNGMIQISQSFFTRADQFSTISASKIIHSITGGLTQIVTGITGFNFTGLVIGRVAGLFSADINYLNKFLKSYKWMKRNKDEEKRLIKKHKKFIFFTSPGVFIGNSINLVILIMLTHFYGDEFTGLTAAAIQYLGIICMLFSSSFAQVYFNEIAQINDAKKLISSYSYWIKRLGMFSLMGLVLLYFIPSSIVTYVLGEKWSGLLYIIKIISPWMGLMFMTSSLSYIFIRLGKQKEIFFFDIFHLVLIVGTLFTSQLFFNDGIETLYVITIAQSIFYILSISLALKFLIENLKNRKLDLD